MKVKHFVKLTRIDFNNGAVLDEIRRDLKIRDELLQACKKVVNNWGNLHPKDRQQLRATIAKAEGEQGEGA